MNKMHVVGQTKLIHLFQPTRVGPNWLCQDLLHSFIIIVLLLRFRINEFVVSSVASSGEWREGE